MPLTFPVDSAELIAERAPQWQDGAFRTASKAYGRGKLPVLDNAAHTRANDNQVRTCLRWATAFEAPFERHLAEVSCRGGGGAGRRSSAGSSTCATLPWPRSGRRG